MASTSASESSATYLEIDRIEVTYGAVTALHEMSLQVRSGEFFCLLGPSGCGKSTTLNVVAGFLPVTRGRVLLAGQDMTDLAPQRRQIGVVFQSYALFPHMTAADNIGYGLRLQKRPREEIQKRVAALIALVRLDGKGERYPRQLSGGEQQRVAIARALAIEPRLLLLDEPLSNLDARLREEMRDELKRIQRTTGVTTIFVTHDQEEAFGAGDRVAVMNKGYLEQVGTPAEIYRSPKTAFCASFIGRSNKLEGVVATGERGAGITVGSHFIACAADAPAPKEKATLFLRPEDIVLGSSVAESNRLPGRVASVVYSGTLINYRIDTDLGELHACRLGSAGDGFGVGAPVEVGWSAAAGSVFPADKPWPT